MSKPKFYSLTNIVSIPTVDRDVDGVYFLRTSSGFQLFRVNEVTKDFIRLEVNNAIQNQTSQQSSANFNIDGSGKVGGLFEAGSLKVNGGFEFVNEYSYPGGIYSPTNGIYIETDILGTSTDFITLNITGHGYSTGKIINTKIQFYLRQNPNAEIYYPSGLSLGQIFPINIFVNSGGYVSFWISPANGIAAANTFRFKLGTIFTSNNKITSVTNVDMPSGVTAEVTLTPSGVLDMQSGIQNQFSAVQTANYKISGSGAIGGNLEIGGYIKPNSTSNLHAGMYGLYLAGRVGHIWSMDPNYQIAHDGSGLGNLYGMAYSFETGPNGMIAGLGHQIVFAADGVAYSGISLNQGNAYFRDLAIGDVANSASNVSKTPTRGFYSQGDIYGGNKVIAEGGVGFRNKTYITNAANPIWSFDNASSYGMAYYQGSAGFNSTDAIGFHFGDINAPKFWTDLNGNAEFKGYLKIGVAPILTSGDPLVCLLTRDGTQVKERRIGELRNDMGGASYGKLIKITADYTVTDWNFHTILIDCDVASSLTITLPNPSSLPNAILRVVVRGDVAGNTYKFDGSYIPFDLDGSALSYDFLSSTVYLIQSDGTDWTKVN